MSYGHKCAIPYCVDTAVYGVAKIRYKNSGETEYRVFTRPVLPDKKLVWCGKHAWRVRDRREEEAQYE